MRVGLVFISCLSLAQAFVAPKSTFAAPRVAANSRAFPVAPSVLFAEKNSKDESGLSLPSVASATAALWSLAPMIASADSPDWGIFEGRTGSLLHPIMMFGLLGLSVSTGLLGFQWRRQRTIGDDIKEAKKRLPDLGGAKTVSEALAAAKSAESVDTALVNKLEAALPVQEELSALEAERKQLSSSNPREKHFSQGALLAFLGTAFAIEVCFYENKFQNVYMECKIGFSLLFLTLLFSFLLTGPTQYFCSCWKIVPCKYCMNDSTFSCFFLP
jgi:hypothetical protein